MDRWVCREIGAKSIDCGRTVEVSKPFEQSYRAGWVETGRLCQQPSERVGLELQPVHDVRGLSTYDAAAAVSAPVRLSQHFRSAPHLIGFNARQFYGEALQVMTVCPQNASADRIHLESVLGGSDRVDDAELDAALDLVDRLGTLGSTSIGLVSPFRKVVDALEERALDRWSLADLDRLGLQIGTVHGFQGSERDSIVAVLGLAAEPNASGLRWLQRRPWWLRSARR